MAHADIRSGDDRIAAIARRFVNDVEGAFLPDLALRHHAGCHVLAHDLRNHGDSATAHDGSITTGVLESAEVVEPWSGSAAGRTRTACRSGCSAAAAAVHAVVAAPDKELFWIEDSTRHWDGYLHFQREPARILNLPDTHLAADER